MRCRPQRERADERLVSSAQTIRSEHSARSVPPPTQYPWTWAITGFGERHSRM